MQNYKSNKRQQNQRIYKMYDINKNQNENIDKMNKDIEKLNEISTKLNNINIFKFEDYAIPEIKNYTDFDEIINSKLDEINNQLIDFKIKLNDYSNLLSLNIGEMINNIKIPKIDFNVDVDKIKNELNEELKNNIVINKQLYYLKIVITYFSSNLKITKNFQYVIQKIIFYIKIYIKNLILLMMY